MNFQAKSLLQVQFGPQKIVQYQITNPEKPGKALFTFQRTANSRIAFHVKLLTFSIFSEEAKENLPLYATVAAYNVFYE